MNPYIERVRYALSMGLMLWSHYFFYSTFIMLYSNAPFLSYVSLLLPSLSLAFEIGELECTLEQKAKPSGQRCCGQYFMWIFFLIKRHPPMNTYSFAFLYFPIALIGIHAFEKMSLIFNFVSHAQRMPGCCAGHMQSMKANYNNERKRRFMVLLLSNSKASCRKTAWYGRLKAPAITEEMITACLLQRSVHYLRQDDWKYPYGVR